ncbi:hypothetical protein SKAU_G00053380 [Synaphobranchus kaupii]|uniref:Uncharacterized protein n=1 Tax=Synaphobranchus kaupii TaxID=118154 RepID=A0A9Q1G4B9_SYNKA|nr:hypothetical protein SKAU_G00053380 [Synaphobranchus kaupii]
MWTGPPLYHLDLLPQLHILACLCLLTPRTVTDTTALTSQLPPFGSFAITLLLCLAAKTVLGDSGKLFVCVGVALAVSLSRLKGD